MIVHTSTLAEVNLQEIFDKLDNRDVVYLQTWLAKYCTFQHAEAYEFIHHLFADESEEWFLEKILKNSPDYLHQVMLDARKAGAARICFYV